MSIDPTTRLVRQKEGSGGPGTEGNSPASDLTRLPYYDDQYADQGRTPGENTPRSFPELGQGDDEGYGGLFIIR